MQTFKKFIKELKEETVASDIATVDTKLDLTKQPKHLSKGKKCKEHNRLRCQECRDNMTESWS